jgi:hypothetical protein
MAAHLRQRTHQTSTAGTAPIPNEVISLTYILNLA